MNIKINQLKNHKMTYGLDDICITPSRITSIEHRSECNPYNLDGMLPLFTAPMNSIINEQNYESFLKNRINTIIPRGVDYNTRWELSTKTFVALSLSEFETFIIDYTAIYETTDDVRYVCVDIANGHMKKLIDLCKLAKEIFGERLLLMAGNIANPDTYIDYALAGIDFVRIGIGGGSVCTTSANGGVHYAMASLIKHVCDQKWNITKAIQEASRLKINCKYQSVPLIVADGGFNNYDRIIKALALGADYVMVGKLFAQCEESCPRRTEIYCIDPSKLRYVDNTGKTIIPRGLKWTFDEKSKTYYSSYKVYYGMSTKKAQAETGNKVLKTAEGIEIMVPILYKLEGWCENFISYLRSAMSYTNSTNLEEFKTSSYTIISNSEYLSYHK